MIAIVVPAHNEEDLIGACLRSLLVASRGPVLKGEPVVIIVALDACSDRTESIARTWGAICIVTLERNVGRARACGAQAALDAGARWLAFTDADTVVAPDWLSTQLSLGSDVVCGGVEVHEWATYGERMKSQFEATYAVVDGHGHVHGANLGVSAQAYRNAGGFRPLATSEDVALVDALHGTGACIAWSAAPRVVTSARRGFRAAGGFGAMLEQMERTLACVPAQT